MSTLISESVNLTSAPAKSGRIRIKIIDEGQGSSGFYPATTLEAAAKDKVFPKGTHMFLDHPSVTENFDRPERSLRDLAAVLDSDAVFESGALYADAKVFAAYRELLTDPEVFEAIGVSIRASAEVEETKTGRNVVKLVSSESVDFVTKAGRGGKVMEVLESARINSRAITRGVAEATANDTREWLQSAVRADKDRWAWVRDFDDTNVWFEAESDTDTMRTYQQGYTLSGNTAALTGEPIEVRVETRYVPISAAPAAESKNSPPVPAGSTQKKEDAPMATTQIEEAELATLREAASRATTAEAELATERATRATEAKAARKDKAEAIVKEAFGDDVPAFFLNAATMLAESADFDPEKLRTDATEAAAKIAVDNGAGTPRGVGETAKVTESGKTFTPDMIVDALHGKVA
jgi:hypothetical protein